jgi:hypothetical protein
MSNSNDIFQQAQNGSVAAIIQLLNERLSEVGVRTRAVFDAGILQLLCEAATPEQLQQSELVPLLRQILEDISPLNIRRVNINSRIVREQQLLWLDEITRDPQGQLLWSEEIKLKKKNIIQIWLENNKKQKRPETFPSRSVPRNVREKQLFWRGILLGGLGLFAIIWGGQWAYQRWLNNSEAKNNQKSLTTPSISPTVPEKKTPVVKSPTVKKTNDDPFAEAVRLAEKTANMGKVAKTKAEWLEIAAKWQKASDLMAKVPKTNQSYKIAQNRRDLYRKFSENAQKEVQRLR